MIKSNAKKLSILGAAFAVTAAMAMPALACTASGSNPECATGLVSVSAGSSVKFGGESIFIADGGAIGRSPLPARVQVYTDGGSRIYEKGVSGYFSFQHTVSNSDRYRGIIAADTSDQTSRVRLTIWN